MKCDNLEAAKKLVETYRAITLETLTEKFNENSDDYSGNDLMRVLTGFGDTYGCTLCSTLETFVTGRSCKGCIHFIHNYYGAPCVNKTYIDIAKAKNAEELFKALKARADYIESLIEKIEK